jgi:uroporphyrinogen-III synthase
MSGGLPLVRLSLLAGLEPAAASDGKIVCACFSVGEASICSAIRAKKLTTPAEIGAVLQAGTNCGSCIPELKTAAGLGRGRVGGGWRDMTGVLDGLTILVPESRELDRFCAMLEAEGAAALRCPLVRILDLDDSAEAEAWIERLIAGTFEDVVWLTGEGLRRLLAIAERAGRRTPFVEALSRVRAITRGPKPARALRDLGLSPGLAATAPTSQGLLDALAGEDLAGRSIGVQLYPGEGGLPLLASLRSRGAAAFPVTPYRYASQTQAAEVADAIHALAAGRIGMIAFTSSPQVERLIEVAREAGLEPQLREAFSRVHMAAIGPVVEETLHRHGVANILRPDSNFHLKPLVRAIAAAWSAR